MGSTVDRNWLIGQLDQTLKIEEKLPVTIGVDVGQIHDPTAVCVCEVEQKDTGKRRYTSNPEIGHHDEKGQWIPPKSGMEMVMQSEYTVKQIKRLPLNTSYPEVAEYLADMLDNEIFQNRNVRVLIDVTGVGRPVYDALKLEIQLRRNNTNMELASNGVVWKFGKYKLELKPISFVHGEAYNKSKGSLGKAFLVSRLQTLFQWDRFHAPDTPEVRAMCEEFMVYEIKVDDRGKDTYGAKIGKHDDLATSAGLACLEDPYNEKVRYSERVY